MGPQRPQRGQIPGIYTLLVLQDTSNLICSPVIHSPDWLSTETARAHCIRAVPSSVTSLSNVAEPNGRLTVTDPRECVSAVGFRPHLRISLKPERWFTKGNLESCLLPRVARSRPEDPELPRVHAIGSCCVRRHHQRAGLDQTPGELHLSFVSGTTTTRIATNILIN